MATSSIYNSIKVQDKKFCTKLVDAMEQSHACKGKEVVLSKSVKELNQDQIKEIFKKD